MAKFLFKGDGYNTYFIDDSKVKCFSYRKTQSFKDYYSVRIDNQFMSVKADTLKKLVNHFTRKWDVKDIIELEEPTDLNFSKELDEQIELDKIFNSNSKKTIEELHSLPKSKLIKGVPAHCLLGGRKGKGID